MTPRYCLCTREGEHPNCPFHGYEAVIERQTKAIDEIVDYMEKMMVATSNPIASFHVIKVQKIASEAYKSPPHGQPQPRYHLPREA